ncbi:hypothetical protein LCGC14_1717860 [marine sediment metagenome]|uniref:Uncharacterized protein n=1 Tax=marine sediment metagenome TaxID=412755 RepID=A0A0F9I0Y1_9ZZZZ
MAKKNYDKRMKERWRRKIDKDKQKRDAAWARPIMATRPTRREI